MNTTLEMYKMTARDALIQTIFNGGTLIEIPFFQRYYIWQEDLWQLFMDDMEYISQTGKPHFFGPLIFKKGRAPESGDYFTKRYTVVDGQQRLTTLFIFMKVLCLKSNQTAMFDAVFRIFGKRIALSHSRNDIDAFTKVMQAETAQIIENSVPHSSIIPAFNFFVEHIDENKLSIMKILQNAQFVRIKLDSDENEQEIFDSINSIGVDLTTSDLLKNYFFSSETIHEYQETWESVFEKDEDARIYWNMLIETGRVKRAMIDIFFDAYFQLFIQNKEYGITGDDKKMYARLNNLAQSYQHFIKYYCHGDKHILLDPLRKYAECFMQSFQPEQCDRCVPNEYGIERINVIIFGLKNATLIPYILFIAMNVGDPSKRNEIYRIIESFIMRRMVIHASNNNYNNIFTSLIQNQVVEPQNLRARLLTSNDQSTYVPNDDELQEGFHRSLLTNLQAKGILYLIESKLHPANSAVTLLGLDGYSLEHLMPKKWRNKWEPCTDADEAHRRDGILLTLGNLAIITQSLNASIRDAPWNVKKVGKGDGKPGLYLCAGGLCTLYDALTTEVWDEKEIETRADWLFEQARKIWRL